MAARIRSELGLEVEMVRGRYGEYRVLVDDEVVVDGGPQVIIGMVPPARRTLQLVRARLS